ncbi:uncharacterized protein LOC144721055 [Lampetra planeri]
MCRWGCTTVDTTFMCKWCGTRYCGACGRGDFTGCMSEPGRCRKCFQKSCQGRRVEYAPPPPKEKADGAKGRGGTGRDSGGKASSGKATRSASRSARAGGRKKSRSSSKGARTSGKSAKTAKKAKKGGKKKKT